MGVGVRGNIATFGLCRGGLCWVHRGVVAEFLIGGYCWLREMGDFGSCGGRCGFGELGVLGGGFEVARSGS